CNQSSSRLVSAFQSQVFGHLRNVDWASLSLVLICQHKNVKGCSAAPGGPKGK
ncbi:unnamed protein product, partial [Dovyalis caffra]